MASLITNENDAKVGLLLSSFDKEALVRVDVSSFVSLFAFLVISVVKLKDFKIHSAVCVSS